MFSAVGKLVDYFWNKEEKESVGDGSSVDDQSDSRDSHAYTDKNGYQRELDGKITHIFSTHGMINDEIYFSFEDVIGGVRPQLGDSVSLKAVQEHKGGGWHAENVYIINKWSDEEDEPADSGKPTDVVGIITEFDGKVCYVNNSHISFFLENCEKGFLPSKGDWIKADLKYTDSPFPLALNVQPLRVKHTEGVVSAFQHDHGYIDGQIFFTPNICTDNYQPQKWDPVKVKAIESNQGGCNWRAVSVTKADVTSTAGLKLFGGPLLKSFIQELCADKKGINITNEADFGNVAIGSQHTLVLWVTNTNPDSSWILRKCHMTADCSQIEIVQIRHGRDNNFSLAKGCRKFEGEITLHPQMPLAVDIRLMGRTPGKEKQLIVFTFDDFKIGRYITANVLDSMQVMENSFSQYTGGQRVGYSRYREAAEKKTTPWVVPGERTTRFKRKIQLPNKLPQFPIPPDLRDCVLQRDDLVTYYPALGKELSFENYMERFHVLLHLEEIQNEIDIRDFDMDRVCMRRVGEYLGLKVPGLAEGRPSVLIWDKILLTDPTDPDGPCFEGFVHEVLSDEVLLKFNPEFQKSYTGKDYNVQFTYNRGPMRRCHQAVEFAIQLGKNVLFPTRLIPKLPQDCQHADRQTYRNHCSRNKSSLGHKFFNKILNDRQKAAVRQIVQGQGRPLPYILFGPPGTGKTVTVVESILQIFTLIPSSRIIACTPSNSAADLLTERLLQSGLLKTSDLVRLNAVQRSIENIPEILKPYCSTGNDLDITSHYRILVCTCVTAGALFSHGIKAGHFSHVFIDEAGQSTEPECMISAGLVAYTDGQIVLAGDPLQLGPVLRSNFALTYGLNLSWLERLISLPLYERNDSFANHGSYDPLLVTKLVDNYRSHSAILSLPSQLFYHDELIVQAERQLTQTFVGWKELPNPNVPVIFHGIRGDDVREGDSPSWFNPVETVQVVCYLQTVLQDPSFKIRPDDIGVITPYRKQVEKIRLLINKLGMDMMKVGSVEEFQGQERPVIIISTVRSNEDLIGFDQKHSLGFLSNPKRFNVSITRAQALLVIIGNPYVLMQDVYWKALIEYCVKNGAYKGCDLPLSSFHL
ncbi:hypothetical protein CHS0354_004830 [Potamilus streckersoni]|uniref:RNA helicase n=1 Tax=Potamilus streckersoni TaxID=2493646 RepID=A0AAE0S9K8_9BIVA|nr:hypothetical protein CHS0354_004830 [Potamilus streckersoni]